MGGVARCFVQRFTCGGVAAAEDSPTPNPWISADQPIGTRSEDRLERAAYAVELALAIEAWTGTHSLTIALYGAWAAGILIEEHGTRVLAGAAQVPAHDHRIQSLKVDGPRIR
jgi:hypothetical protein